MTTQTSTQEISIPHLLKNAKFLVFDLKNDNQWIIQTWSQVVNGLKLHGYMQNGSELEAGILFYQASLSMQAIQFEDLSGTPDFAIQMF